MRTLSRTIIMGLVAAMLVFAVAPCADTVPAPVLAESVPVDQALGSLEPLLGLFEGSSFGVEPDEQNLPTAEKVNVPEPPAAAPYAAGDIIQTWPAASPSPWGIAYTWYDTVWVGEGWGNNYIYEYQADGTPTGLSYPYPWSPANGPADDAFNWNTGMIWTMDVGGDNCIHEMDPTGGYTGVTICPGFPVSQRGLAYDPYTDTYFAGGWNDQKIYRFAADGTILAAVDVGLAIAGLAYNLGMQYLYAIVNAAPNPVYVLDAADNYNILGGFTLAGFSDYGGAGLEMDRYGYLWAVDQQTQIVYQFDPGPDPYEPDNTPSQANWIHDGAPQIHSIVPVGDVDWVKFSLSEESEVVIETSGPRGDTRMWLYDSGLNELEINDDSGSNLFSRIDRLCGTDALPAGTYYVKIDEYKSNDEIPSYNITFTVLQPCGDGSLTYLPAVQKDCRPTSPPPTQPLPTNTPPPTQPLPTNTPPPTQPPPTKPLPTNTPPPTQPPPTNTPAPPKNTPASP